MHKGSLKHVDEIDVNDIGEDDYMGTGDDTDFTSDMFEDEAYAEGDEDVVYEIDEQELNEAIYQMRTQRIEEGKVRQQVRKELKQVVSEMTSGSSWMYGNKQPTNSQPGRVSRGFAGPGFKR